MIWVNYNDLTATEPWEYVFLGKSSPFMAELFRLVKYYNLPRPFDDGRNGVPSGKHTKRY